MKEKLIDATTQLVSSYLVRNDIKAEQLPQLIEQVARSIAKIGEGSGAKSGGSGWEGIVEGAMESGRSGRLYEESAENAQSVRYEGRSPQDPAVSLEDSVTDDYIICLEDGKKLKMLKRHLKSFYGMSPDDYRRKWNLPKNYPMVCRTYANFAQPLGQRRRPRRRYSAKGGFNRVKLPISRGAIAACPHPPARLARRAGK